MHQTPGRSQQIRGGFEVCHRAHSALPEVFANPDCQPTDSAAPLLPLFTAQPGIHAETANLTEDLYQLIVDQSNLYAQQYIAAHPNSTLPDNLCGNLSQFPNLKLVGLTLNVGITKKRVAVILLHRPESSSYALVL